MLARSASGPAGLSINTGSANLFGGTGQPAAATTGGLFGTASSQPAQSGSLFGTAAASKPQATGSLFGGTATTTSQPQTGGLFGTAAAQPAQQPQQTGGLFGATAQPQQQQQQQTGGLFGASTQQQPQQQQQTGGLFGATTQQQPQQTGGLFGASTQQQQPQQQTGGLFGGSTANTGGMLSLNKPQGGGMFGNQPQQQQQQQQQGFGQTQGGGLTMGQSTNQQAQMVPGVQIDVSNIRSTTRFNDLQEDLQKQIIMIDDGIQKCIRDKEAVEAFLPAHGEQLSAIPTDVSFVTRKSDGAHAALSADIAAINQLRELIKTDADNARLSFKAVDNLKLPTQYHQASLWSTRGQQSAAAAAGSGDADPESNSDLISYFSKTANEMDDMMKKFERNLGEIEVHMHGVHGNMLEQLQRVAAQSRSNAQGGVDERVAELAAVLRDFEEGILKVAGVVGGIKEGVTELQLKDFMGHGS
ncbi:hypothetical protein QBC39DRAFT_348443 [Podospora conica]|nr:hypothetical protein QBC39DRAFT_348443 [Schizothecium conicum]